jgi:hypothetical protein
MSLHAMQNDGNLNLASRSWRGSRTDNKVNQTLSVVTHALLCGVNWTLCRVTQTLCEVILTLLELT